jgi:hypothetical protein
MDERLRRRHVLSAAAVALAGCAGQSDSTNEETTATTERASATETTTQTTQETTNPDVSVKATFSTPETTATVAYEVVVESPAGIESVTVTTPSGDEVHATDGNTSVSVSGAVDAAGGELNAVEVVVETGSGTATATVGRQYARLYEPLGETDIDVGAVYIPFMGGKWDSCAVGEAAVGEYTTGGTLGPEDRAAVSRHVDQHRGFGVGPVMFNFGENSRDRRRFRNFRASPLADEVAFECFYVLSQALRRDRPVGRDLDFVQSDMFPLDTYATVDGRSCSSGVATTRGGCSKTTPCARTERFPNTWRGCGSN